MNDIDDRLESQRKLIALSAAMGAGRQLQALMADEIEAREEPKSTGKSRMEAVVARRAANWTKKRPAETPTDE